MIYTHFLQADRCFAILQFSNKTPVLILSFQYLATGFEVRIQTRHFLPEIIQRTFKEIIGHKQILFYIRLFQPVTGFTCQDHQFTDNILTTQVDTRIRFGVTLFLRHLNGLAERNIRTDLIKYIVQRATQHCFNLQYLVTTMDKVIDRIDNRKSRTHIRFKEILHTTLTGNLFQFTVVLIFRGSGNFIGSHYGNVV